MKKYLGVKNGLTGMLMIEKGVTLGIRHLLALPVGTEVSVFDYNEGTSFNGEVMDKHDGMIMIGNGDSKVIVDDYVIHQFGICLI